MYWPASAESVRQKLLCPRAGLLNTAWSSPPPPPRWASIAMTLSLRGAPPASPPTHPIAPPTRNRTVNALDSEWASSCLRYRGKKKGNLSEGGDHRHQARIASTDVFRKRVQFRPSHAPDASPE